MYKIVNKLIKFANITKYCVSHLKNQNFLNTIYYNYTKVSM